LPVASFSHTTWNNTVVSNVVFTGYVSSAVVSASTTLQPFNVNTGGAAVALSDVEFANDSIIHVSGTYFVS